jgi:hypothetical protein
MRLQSNAVRALVLAHFSGFMKPDQLECNNIVFFCISVNYSFVFSVLILCNIVHVRRDAVRFIV